MNSCRKAIAIVAILVVLISVVSLGTLFVFFQSNTVQGTSAALLHTQDDASAQVDAQYGGEIRYEKSIKTKKLLSSPNVSQNTVNNYYNYRWDQRKTAEVTGTCSEVATLMLVKSYGFGSTYTNNNAFCVIMDIAVANEYWSPSYDAEGNLNGGGTNVTKIDSLATKSFTRFLSKKKGNNDVVNIYNTLKSEINESKTAILSCENHSMLAVGYLTYKVTYKRYILGFIETWYEKAIDYVIVNDGWFDAGRDIDSEQYSYYPVASINSNFRLTKVTGYDS
ncbi:MAG: hypothetical protein LBE09_08840 [Christensenellaceae bacterium]|nr:hypothetical protein [Christensenellaceae bacterium]